MMQNEWTWGRSLGSALSTALLWTAVSAGQPGTTATGLAAPQDWRRASHVVVPQVEGWALASGRQPILVTGVKADIVIVEQTARTTLDIALHNPGSRQAEAILLLPVPAKAAVSNFAFDGEAQGMTAEVLGYVEARATYDEIVRKIKDPALLEFAGYNLIRSSIFPIAAGGEQHIRVTYEHLLEEDGGRIDYELPRSESLSLQVPWDISVDIRSSAAISMIYSPSHDLNITSRKDQRIAARVRQAGQRDPGPFRISYLHDNKGVTASLMAYPNPDGPGGYFLLMAGLPVDAKQAETQIKREVTVVLDRSGSMSGQKLVQAKAAALQVIAGLDPGESFNIIDYSSSVASFAPAPVIVSAETKSAAEEYLAGLKSNGGTNIYAALQAAIANPPRAGELPLVLFLTDGLPTEGITGEGQIGDMIAAENKHGRRIFTFGVGNDVNVPLLDRISDTTRATGYYVLPGEDVELKVAAVFKHLQGPILANPELVALDAQGQVSTRIVRDMLPGILPDLYDGDQLVVLGQYREEGPLHFRLTGNLVGEERSFTFDFDLHSASTRNAFVPRLWATRRIAMLVDRIRQLGLHPAPAALVSVPGSEPSTAVMEGALFKELSQEIMELSTRFGVLSEYTSFLALEGTDLADLEAIQKACDTNLNLRAVLCRSGEAAVNQGRNFNDQKAVQKLAVGNSYWNDSNQRVRINTLQQISDRAFIQKANCWVDTRLVGDKEKQKAKRTVTFGSPEHSAMLHSLAAQGRQGVLSLRGDILLEFEGETVLVVNTQPASEQAEVQTQQQRDK